MYDLLPIEQTVGVVSVDIPLTVSIITTTRIMKVNIGKTRL